MKAVCRVRQAAALGRVRVRPLGDRDRRTVRRIGGLQPEGPEVEIALVFHPVFWGKGKAVYDSIK